MSKEQFLSIAFDTLDNKKFREVMSENKGIMMTWLWLRRNIVRAPMDSPYLRKVYNVCYVNGLLATTTPRIKLMKILGVSDKTLTRNIHVLEKSGYIKITHFNENKPSAHKPQNIYVLGRWKNHINKDGMEVTVEFLFADDVVSAENSKINIEELMLEI